MPPPEAANLLSEAPPPWRADPAVPLISVRVGGFPEAARARTLAIAGDRKLAWVYAILRFCDPHLLLLDTDNKPIGQPILRVGTFHWSRLTVADMERIERTLGTSWYGLHIHRSVFGLRRTIVWDEEVRLYSPKSVQTNAAPAGRKSHVQGRSVSSYLMGSSDDGADGRDGFCAGGAYDAGW